MGKASTGVTCSLPDILVGLEKATTHKMRYGSEQREKTHNSLVEAASALVRRDGPDKISVSELMKSVGLTHGGFYYHFSSREDMIARAIERAFASTQERLEGICHDNLPAAVLREYVERYLS